MSILDKYPFLVIHGPGGDFLMGQEVGGAGQFFWYFWDLLSIGLPTVYNTKILNEHPLFLLILGPFLGMARSGWDIFSFFDFKTLPWRWVSTVYSMKGYAWVVWPKKLNKWTDGETSFWDSSSTEVESSNVLIASGSSSVYIAMHQPKTVLIKLRIGILTFTFQTTIHETFLISENCIAASDRCWYEYNNSTWSCT